MSPARPEPLDPIPPSSSNELHARDESLEGLEGDAELPEYSRPLAHPRSGADASLSTGPSTVHEIVPGNDTRAWVKMTVLSSARDADSVPYFFEGQPIAGKVELDLQKPFSIKSITVSVSLSHSSTARLDL